MANLERFGVSMEEDLLNQLDAMIVKRGYKSRSEALRDLVRQEMVKQEWSNPDGEVMGTITIVYDHEQNDLSTALNRLQHENHDYVVCTTHVHVDHHNCLEVIIVRGAAYLVRQIADALISAKGVKHGQLVCTTTGRQIN